MSSLLSGAPPESNLRRFPSGSGSLHGPPEVPQRDPAAHGGVDERDDTRMAAGREEPDDVQVYMAACQEFKKKDG
jgi:hypothetical protein